MFGKRRLNAPRVAAKRVAFPLFRLDTETDEGEMELNRSPRLVNLRSDTGALTPGPGVEAASFLAEQPPLGSGRARAAYYRRYDGERGVQDDRLVFWAEGEPLRYVFLGGEDRSVHTVPYAPLAAPPNFVTYRLDGEDVLLVSSPKDSLLIWDGADRVETVPDAPKISSMCLHYERLFATDSAEGTRLWFSDDLDVRNWNVSLEEGGFLDIVDQKGRLLRAISFLDCVYVFRSYGISRLSAYGDQTQFAVQELFAATGRIRPESVALCGERILFLAEDGLYTFDGLSARRLALGLAGVFRGANCEEMAACFYGGKYYAAFMSPWQARDTGGNNVLLEYDTVTGGVALAAGLDVVALAPLTPEEGSCLAVLYREDGVVRCGQLAPRSVCGERELVREWRSPLSNYGWPGRRKRFKRLLFESAGAVDVVVEADGATQKYAVPGGEQAVSLPINLVGERARVTLFPRGADCRVGNVRLDMELL